MTEKSEAEKTARNLALKRAGVREYAVSEMEAYLNRKGVDPGVAARTVAALEKEGVLSDARYAAVIARHQGLRGKGPMHVLAKLKQKGVKIGLREVQKLFEENLPDSEMDSARKIIERRYPNARQDRAERQRAYQALLRRGFSSEIARRCLSGRDEEEGPTD